MYVLIAFLACALVALACTLLVPGVERRRRWVQRCARGPFRLAGIPVTVRGLDQLPDGPCVLVANHASYIDGVVGQAFLPPRFSFVIKGEMARVPVAGFLLRRLGHRFVDRFSPQQSARDARQLVRAADGGETLAFFPEGTFKPYPGLHAFRLGAFAAARKGGLPVVPVVLRGSRDILRADWVLPRRAPLDIDVLPPIDVNAAGSSRALAALARERILDVLGEPDLTKRAD